MQIFALLLLVCASIILNSNAGSVDVNFNKEKYNLGIGAALLASLLSGLAGALCQFAYKLSIPRDPSLLTAEMAIYSLLLLVIQSTNQNLLRSNLWHDWTEYTIIPVATGVRVELALS